MHWNLYLLHCWQNRCLWPLIITCGVLEWSSQTLWRRWYSLQLLRSAMHPSTRQGAVWTPLLLMDRGLFDDPEGDNAIFGTFNLSPNSLPESIITWPSFKSTQKSPFLIPSAPKQFNPFTLSILGIVSCSNCVKSQEGALKFHSMASSSTTTTKHLIKVIYGWIKRCKSNPFDIGQMGFEIDRNQRIKLQRWIDRTIW